VAAETETRADHSELPNRMRMVTMASR